jgi:hypothetical protein
MNDGSAELAALAKIPCGDVVQSRLLRLRSASIGQQRLKFAAVSGNRMVSGFAAEFARRLHSWCRQASKAIIISRTAFRWRASYASYSTLNKSGFLCRRLRDSRPQPQMLLHKNLQVANGKEMASQTRGLRGIKIA